MIKKLFEKNVVVDLMANTYTVTSQETAIPLPEGSMKLFVL